MRLALVAGLWVVGTGCAASGGSGWANAAPDEQLVQDAGNPPVADSDSGTQVRPDTGPTVDRSPDAGVADADAAPDELPPGDEPAMPVPAMPVDAGASDSPSRRDAGRSPDAGPSGPCREVMFYFDEDGDGFGTTAHTVRGCTAPFGYVSNPNDCNDSASSVNPSRAEVCDLIDNDCSGTADDGLSCDAPALAGDTAYVKASNASSYDHFGSSVAVSGNGLVMAVGAPDESSCGSDTGCSAAGAVYVYSRTTVAGTWSQKAYVKASNAKVDARFGTAVALSVDGKVLAVTAIGENSCADGNNKPDATGCADAGALYLFAEGDAGWTQEAYIKAINSEAGDGFGFSVAVSADGKAVAVGAPLERGCLSGRYATDDNGCSATGMAYVYRKSEESGAWPLELRVRHPRVRGAERFGESVALSANGKVLAVGSPGDRSCAAGAASFATGDDCFASGAAFIYRRSLGSWGDYAGIKTNSPESNDQFGASLSLSYDGAVLGVGAPYESSCGEGINPADTGSCVGNGAAFVFRYSGVFWAQEVLLKSSKSHLFQYLGGTVMLSADGTRLLAGDDEEAHAFTTSDAVWSERGRIAPTIEVNTALSGRRFAMSASANTVAIGIVTERSCSTGVDSVANTSCPEAGAVFVREVPSL